MDDNSVPLSRVVAGTLSTIAMLMIVSAWIVALSDDYHVGIMVGITAMPVVAAAAVSWIRCYSLRVCSMLRATSHLRGSDGGSVYSIH